MALITMRQFLRVADRCDCVRFWDLAGSEPTRKNRDPDWTAGVLAALDPERGRFYLVRADRIQATPAKGLDFIASRMDLDDLLMDREVPVRIERPAAEGGLYTTEMFFRRFPGRDLDFRRPKGSKPARAVPVSTAAEAGRWDVVEGPWDRDAFFDELDLFPDGAHDDQVDALSGAAKELRDRNHAGDAAPETVDDAGSFSLSEWGA